MDTNQVLLEGSVIVQEKIGPFLLGKVQNWIKAKMLSYTL
jgi:hypothetical protein